MRSIFIAGLMGLAILPARAGDDFYTGNNLRSGCLAQVSSQGSVSYTSGICIGMVVSTSEALHYLKLACYPSGTTYEQGIRVLLKYMAAHPEETHERLTTLTIRAFKQTWPCKDSEAPSVSQQGRVF